MCGLIGALHYKEAVQEQTLQKALHTLHHRGPDDQGLWIDVTHRIALGHRRLSIIDLSSGQQPFTNQDQTVHLIMNGELYDHQAMREKLIQKGHHFKTHSDNEIALHLYIEYGLDFVNHLRGEFAFVIWDDRHNQLIAGRDRFGVKPLVYHHSEKGLFLASEAKALFAMGIAAKWDHYAFYHSANMQYTPQDQTLFDGISQIQPGHLLIAQDKDIRLKKYWDMDYPDIPSGASAEQDDASYISQFSELFHDAVKTRLQADVPVCFHLSGGLDSSAVLGVAAQYSSKPLDAFCVSFDHDIYDEYDIAQEMADYSGANLHVVNVSQDDLVYELPDAVYHGEGLAINGHLSAKLLLNRAINKAGFKVALTGEGSDEVLAGYPHLRQDLLNYDDTPSSPNIQEIYQSNSVSTGVQLAYGQELNTNALLQTLGFVPSFLKAKASLGYRIKNILNDDFKTPFKNTDCYADLMTQLDISGQLNNRHVVHQSSYIWSKLTLANYILKTLGDGMEMSHSIEGRLPFLDHKMFAFLRTLPLHMKIKKGVEKYILREAVKPYVSKTIYQRQKHPFMAPPISLFSNQKLNDFIQDTVESSSFKNIPFFDRGKVKALLSNLNTMTTAERRAYEPVLMTVLTTGLLQERFNLG